MHGNAGEDPTEGHWSQAVPVAGGLARAADPAALRRARRGRLPPVPRAVRHPARRGRPGPEHVHPLHVVRRLPVPGARQVRRRDDRRAAAARPCRTSRCSSTPRSTRLETDAVRAHRHRRRRVPRRAARRSTRPTSSSCRPAPRTRPSCCCARPTTAIPNGLANGSDQVGRNYMFHNCKAVVALAKEPNDTVFQKTLGHQRLLLRRTATTSGRPGNIQMVGKSNAEAMKGEEPKLTKLAPHWSPGRRRPARRRLLAHHRGPARCPRTGSPSTATATSTSPTRRPTTTRPTGSTTS